MTVSREEQALVDGLRARDEAAFRDLVRRYHSTLMAVARSHVRTDAAAEEVVADTWLAVLQGIDRFEGRSSFKTWLVRIAMNKAKTKGVREARSVPESSLVGADDDGPSVPFDRFTGNPGAGMWAAPVARWALEPDQKVISDETMRVVADTIARLPANQREVVTLRDQQGWTSEEVREVLGISEVNQRVLLHRGRSRVRAAVEAHLAEVTP